MKRYNLLNFSLAMINPVLGFFSALMSLLKGRDASVFFAFSVALICIYFPIMYDTSSNFYLSYNAAQYTGGFHDWSRPYVALPAFLMNKFQIDYYYFVFFNIFFVLYTWAKIVHNSFIESPKNLSNLIIISIVLMFTFNYRDLMDINRNIFAYSFIFYYFFLVEKKSTLKFLFFSFLAIWVHNSSLIIVLVYLISFKPISFRLNYFLIIFSLIAGLLLPSLINKFQQILNSIPVFGAAINYYIYGDDFGVQEFNTGTLLKKILNCFFVFIVSFFAINLLRRNPNDRVLQFLILLGCIELFFLSFVTFFERINLAFNFLYIYLLKYCFNFKVKVIITFLIFIRSCAVYLLIYFPIFFGNYNDVMIDTHQKNSMLVKPFFYFSPWLMDIHNNGYSDDFIHKNSIWGK